GRIQRRYKLGDAKAMSLADAREAARKALAEVDRGIDPAKERIPVHGVLVPPDSFASVAAVYAAKHVQKNTMPRPYRETKHIFDLDLMPVWGARAVASIARRDVEDMIDAIAARGAEVQANRVLARLRTFFNWAVDREYVSASPVGRMKPPTKE